jgi:hypothetical protein
MKSRGPGFAPHPRQPFLKALCFFKYNAAGSLAEATEEYILRTSFKRVQNYRESQVWKLQALNLRSLQLKIALHKNRPPVTWTKSPRLLSHLRELWPSAFDLSCRILKLGETQALKRFTATNIDFFTKHNLISISWDIFLIKSFHTYITIQITIAMFFLTKCRIDI